MISRTELNTYLQTYLACNQFKDYAPNGLQIEGKTNIQRICTAVTASEAAIIQAVALKADALLVHHGYFWRGEDPVLTGMKRQRIGHLIAHDMNLFAYHLPLDCHLEIGNNACLAKLLNVKHLKKHTAGQIPNLLWSGCLKQSILANDFLLQLTQQFNREPIYIAGSQKPIQTIAWCSGAAQDYIEEAHQLGVDAYISGEISERTYYQAKELGIHYFACGHHATERYGIMTLGTQLAAQFDLIHQFIDSDNPI